jgi:hypothetical protein
VNVCISSSPPLPRFGSCSYSSRETWHLFIAVVAKWLVVSARIDQDDRLIQMFKKPSKDWGVCDDEPVVLGKLSCISPNVPARNVMGSQPTRGVAAPTSTEGMRAVVFGRAHTCRPCPDQKHTTKICITGSKQIQRRASLHQGHPHSKACKNTKASATLTY